MFGLLHELMELALLISACAVCLTIPRPKWAERVWQSLTRTLFTR